MESMWMVVGGDSWTEMISEASLVPRGARDC